MKENIYYPSSDGETNIHAVKWIPDGKPAAVLQIVHGMVEFIERYDCFAEFLRERGFLVVGNDHLGHGESVKSADSYGFFAKENGNAALIRDIDELRKLTTAEYPEIPYFILGHSMGSFLTRQYVERHGEGLKGAIIMGTGNQPFALLNVAKSLCKLIACFKGWDYRSHFIDSMAFGGYNKKFEPARTPKDWLTKDAEIVNRYIGEPKCSFLFTLNGYYNLFYSIKDCEKRANIACVPKDLPVLFVSGKDDPVGGFGKGVEKAYDGFVKAGISDVNIKLYEKDRHEILNETDKETVFADINNWLTSKL